MKLSPLSLYVSAAVFQTAGSSGAAMLAPFFMKEHGYSVAMVGIPLVANGVGRVCSDVLSGVMATYFSPGPLLIIAMIVGLITSVVGYAFIGAMPVFMGAWIVFGLTEAMFALSLRKIGFDQSEPGQQGRVQGQMAAALGIGFTIGPLLGGFVGKWLGPDGLFFLYGAPQTIGMILIFLAGGHRYRRAAASQAPNIWREGSQLLRKLPFLASCLAICQSFLFLVGVTRVAFPFLAVNLRGISLETVGTMVSLSRLTDTCGRYVGGRLCDRIKPAWVILARRRYRHSDVLAASLRHRILDAAHSVGGHDHGLWLYQRRRHHFCAAVGESRREGTRPRHLAGLDFLRPGDRPAGLRRAN